MAQRVTKAINAEIHGLTSRVESCDAFFDNAIDHIRDIFLAGRPLIGLCAAGILIRAVAPHLADKRDEPPVLAVAEDGSAVVPLIGGHRGANAMAQQIAHVLGVAPAITTAGDSAFGVALDDPPPGWRLADTSAAKDAMAALLAGCPARLSGAVPDWLAPLVATGQVAVSPGASAVRLQVENAPPLDYHPRTAILGVGCARNCPPEELARLAEAALAEAEIDKATLAGIASLDLKADEAAVTALAAELALPTTFFSAEALEAETPRLATPSDIVFSEVGCHGVAEGAALAAAGSDATLRLAKRKTARATVAIAEAPAPIAALPGRPRGHLAIVGIGPGQSAWRTPEATRLIAAAEELVGYALYLDLLGPLAGGKPRSEFALGEEEARCRYALERAGEGRRIALISSGDAGIYAMGALVFELLDRPAAAHGISAAARRVEVVTAPGITAMQAAAARAGAPLGHDFCAISLSDLLTPRADILRRVRAAAEGDFVVAFYNPVSMRRRVLLAEAREILLAHRPAETPVLLAANLGRPEERSVHRTLEDLRVEEVDMLTTVIVGSTVSRVVELGDGPRFYTPRGYAAKHTTVEATGAAVAEDQR